MAFDWSAVEGFNENMTAEEKLALLDNYEPPKPAEQEVKADDTLNDNVKQNFKGYVAKAQFDKLSSELAAAKRELKSRMTVEEAKEADRVAAEEALRNELDELRREKKVAANKASFLARGYDDALAEEAAIALTDGDTDTVFALMAKQQTATEKALRAQILKETPAPPSGDNYTDEAAKKAEEEKLRKYFGLR